MTICIVGLGYGGLPLPIQFARSGAKVTGVDIDQSNRSGVDYRYAFVKCSPCLLEMGHGSMPLHRDMSDSQLAVVFT